MNNSKRCIFPSIGWKYPGMALPLVILLVLVGFVFVGVGAYVVKNLFWSSQATVVQAKLYNAAQHGIEWGIAKLWAESSDLGTEVRTFNGNLESIEVVLSDDTPLRAKVGNSPPEADPGIKVDVLFLDCNYEYSGTVTAASDLPPQFKSGSGSGIIDPNAGTLVGSSAIIDPNRFLDLGGGGGKEHRYVIRSKAQTRFGGREVEIEVMVVMNR